VTREPDEDAQARRLVLVVIAGFAIGLALLLGILAAGF
jgi:hypothetical protein